MALVAILGSFIRMVPISMLLTLAGTYLPLTSPCITLTLTSPCITRANPSWKATMDYGPLLQAAWLRGHLQCPLVVPLKSWWRKRSCHCHPGNATRRAVEETSTTKQCWAWARTANAWLTNITTLFYGVVDPFHSFSFFFMHFGTGSSRGFVGLAA